MGGHGRALWQEGRRAFVGMGNHRRAGGREGMGRAAHYKMQESRIFYQVRNANSGETLKQKTDFPLPSKCSLKVTRCLRDRKCPLVWWARQCVSVPRHYASKSLEKYRDKYNLVTIYLTTIENKYTVSV